MAKITVSFTFDDQKHPSLVGWINNLPVKGKSEAIREALDAHLSGKEFLTTGDVHKELESLRKELGGLREELEDLRKGIRDILAMLESGTFLISSSEPKNNGNDEPDDIAEALDNLGL